MMDNAKDILDYLSNNKQRLLKEYHLTQIGLFGSYARGDDTSKSDIDLLVEFESGTDNLYDLKKKLREEINVVFNRNVDICRLKYLKPIIKDRVLNEVKYV